MCSTPSSRKCSFNDHCYPSEYCNINNECAAKLMVGDRCEDNTECRLSDEYSSCENHVCKCFNGFKFSYIKQQCISKEKCFGDEDCLKFKNYCDNGACKKGKKLSEQCENSNECKAYSNNTYCRTKACSCLPGYKVEIDDRSEIEEYICREINYCRKDDDCSINSKGFCKDHKCFYPSSLGDSCTKTEDCLLRNEYAYCQPSTRTCKCTPFFEEINFKCHSISCNDSNQCEWKCVDGFCGCDDDKIFSSFGQCVDKESHKPGTSIF